MFVIPRKDYVKAAEVFDLKKLGKMQVVKLGSEWVQLNLNPKQVQTLARHAIYATEF